VGYLICTKCKSYYKLQSGESAKDFVQKCNCGGELRYVKNLDIVDPSWKCISIRKKPTIRETLTNKSKSLFSFPKMNLKNRLNQFYYNYIGRHVNKARNQNRIHRNSPGMQAGFLNSIINEFNLHNVQWILVVPVTIAITLILTFMHGIGTLVTFVLFLVLGYFSENMILGTKNAAIAGAISFFLGSLFGGSFLLIIVYTLLGIVNGAICGIIGGYIKSKRYI
jgi:hypothetical protein